jgi:hypothetical protein
MAELGSYLQSFPNCKAVTLLSWEGYHKNRIKSKNDIKAFVWSMGGPPFDEFEVTNIKVEGKWIYFYYALLGEPEHNKGDEANT